MGVSGLHGHGQEGAAHSGGGLRRHRRGVPPYRWCWFFSPEQSHSLPSRSQLQRVRYIRFIQEQPSKELASAHILLFSHRPQEAVALLLTARLVYQAIRVNIDLFNWDRYDTSQLQGEA